MTILAKPNFIRQINIKSLLSGEDRKKGMDHGADKQCDPIFFMSCEMHLNPSLASAKLKKE
jgi:hypothetical protein